MIPSTYQYINFLKQQLMSIILVLERVRQKILRASWTGSLEKSVIPKLNDMEDREGV